MKDLIRTVSVVSALAFVVASCGGGDSPATEPATTSPPASTTTPAADTVAANDASRYVGTWVRCVSTGPATSEMERVVIAASGTNTFSFTETNAAYSRAGCAGVAGSVRTDTGTVALNGTKIIGTITADKGLMISGTLPPEKQLFVATSSSLGTGRPVREGGTVDSEGYPDTLDDAVFTRQ